MQCLGKPLALTANWWVCSSGYLLPVATVRGAAVEVRMPALRETKLSCDLSHLQFMRERAHTTVREQAQCPKSQEHKADACCYHIASAGKVQALQVVARGHLILWQLYLLEAQHV